MAAIACVFKKISEANANGTTQVSGLHETVDRYALVNSAELEFSPDKFFTGFISVLGQ